MNDNRQFDIQIEKKILKMRESAIELEDLLKNKWESFPSYAYYEKGKYEAQASKIRKIWESLLTFKE
jgi:hypothetical protein